MNKMYLMMKDSWFFFNTLVFTFRQIELRFLLSFSIECFGNSEIYPSSSFLKRMNATIYYISSVHSILLFTFHVVYTIKNVHSSKHGVESNMNFLQKKMTKSGLFVKIYFLDCWAQNIKFIQNLLLVMNSAPKSEKLKQALWKSDMLFMWSRPP